MNSKTLVTLLSLSALSMVSKPISASMDFAIYSSGTSLASLAVAPGGNFSLDIVVENILAEGLTLAELDAFTYRINFPNQDFTLTGNTFQGDFDNTQAPAGFNGSVPWWTGVNIPITNNADAGSPGATPLVADLYRTTATTTGTPVTSDAVVETLDLLAPLALGNYVLDLNVLEAVDTFGEFHSIGDLGQLEVAVVPLPPAMFLMASALVGLTLVGRLPKRS